MVMSKWLHKLSVLFAVLLLTAATGLSAQVLPVLNSFRDRTFTGTVDVSWPVLFDGCTFVTDSVVMHRSYGAIFRNCSFESRTGTVYLADSGDGMILVDCEVTGCNELRFSRIPSVSDRNYVTGIKINGDECTVLDEQENIIDLDGLEIEESARGISDGPLIMIMSADRKDLKSGGKTVLTVRGLESGMFVGWQSSDPDVELKVDGEWVCTVTAPAQIAESKTVVISAYTEYGLEAACVLSLIPDDNTATSGKKARKRKK